MATVVLYGLSILGQGSDEEALHSHPAYSRSSDSIPRGAGPNPLRAVCSISVPWSSTLGPSSGFSRKYVFVLFVTF